MWSSEELTRRNPVEFRGKNLADVDVVRVFNQRGARLVEVESNFDTLPQITSFDPPEIMRQYEPAANRPVGSLFQHHRDQIQ